MRGGAEVDFWGKERDAFVTMRDKYGVWPTTVWSCDMSDPFTRELKGLLHDTETREGTWEKSGTGFLRTGKKGCFTSATDDQSVYRGKVTASAFNPAVACWALNCFAPKEGLVFDPFAGGGTRAIICAKYGLKYTGVELRQDEVDSINRKAKSLGLTDLITILQGDSTAVVPLPDGCGDFLLTCPPYYDLERYEGGERDLSTCATYEDFLDRLDVSVSESERILKPGAKSCWVVGLHRDKSGKLLPLNHDISNIHKRHGFILKEEIILNQVNNGAIQRIGNFDKGNRRLIRTHEYCLVFEKPQR